MVNRFAFLLALCFFGASAINWLSQSTVQEIATYALIVLLMIVFVIGPVLFTAMLGLKLYATRRRPEKEVNLRTAC